jgi:TP901 family phage tail tape measure protein
MADDSILIRFDGTATGLVNAAKQVATALGQVQKETKDMSTHSMAAGVAMGGIYADLAKKALSFAKDAFGAFTRVAGEVRKMQGILGGTAEDMSRLRFAGEEVGVSTDTMIKSFSILSGHLANNDAVSKKLGVSMKDMAGNVKPSTQILGEVADKLNQMPAGMERTAAARAVLGRGFAELNPLLRQGSEGIKKFAEESDKLGLTMSQKDVNAAKQFKLATKELHATFEGISISLGRALLPAMLALTNAVKGAVQWFTHFMSSGSTAAKIFTVIGAAIGVVVAAIIAYNTYTKIATAVTTLWDAVLDANPIALVAIAIIGLAAVLIGLIKNFKPVGDAFIWFFGLLGNTGGKALAVFVKVLEFVAVAYINLARIAAKAGEVITGNRFWKAIFGGGANESIKSALSALDSFEKKFTSVADGIAKTAWDKGGDIGKKLGEGIVSAINDLKMPSLPSVKGGAEDPTGGGFDFGGGSKKTKKKTDAAKKKREAEIKAQKKAVLDFWTDQVKIARDNLKEARDAALKAKDDMAQLAKDIGESLSKGFSITAMVDVSFAQYLGSDSLLAAYQKKLAKMKEFVTNIKALKALGLPLEMLTDMVNAGVDGGYDTAKLLVSNPSVIGSLQSLQTEINSQASEIGGTLSQAVMAPTVAKATETATAAQGTFTSTLTNAETVGYKPTAEDKALATQDVTQPLVVNIDVASEADPATIGEYVAWAIKTGADQSQPMATPTRSRNVRRRRGK